MAAFGERLRALRTKKQLTRRQLELQAGIPQGVVSKLESGKQAYPSIPVVKRLAPLLGVSVDYLIGMYEEETSEPSTA